MWRKTGKREDYLALGMLRTVNRTWLPQDKKRRRIQNTEILLSMY